MANKSYLDYKKTVTHYSTNVHEQLNTNSPSYKYRVNWADVTSATAKTPTTRPKGRAVSFYYKSSKKAKPFTLTAHDYGFDIPPCAYINKITFTVRMRATGKINVNAPRARFCFYNGKKSVKTNIKNDTGWNEGFYFYNPNKKLSNTWDTYDYVMSGDEFRKRGYPISDLNDKITGIDLLWYDSKDLMDSTIAVDYVTCTVDYEMPNVSVTFDRVTSEINPRLVNVAHSYEVVATYKNKSNAGCCTQNKEGTEQTKKINVTFPHTAHVVVESGNFNETTGEWTVPCKGNDSAKLKLLIMDYTVGTDRIHFANELGNWDYWVGVLPSNDGEGKLFLSHGIMQKGVKSCIEYELIGTPSKLEPLTVTDVNVDNTHSTNPDLEWSIDYERTSRDIEITSSDNNSIVFSAPADKEANIFFRSCFIPTFTGESMASARFDDRLETDQYEVRETPTFIVRNTTADDDNDRDVSEILFNPDIIAVRTHRVASDTEISAYVIDCGVADFDGNAVIQDCTLTASTWEKVDYIGMIPLEYHHYDPKSTFENKAISQDYKNKVYKGKEGVIDENITLKFKCRPRQAITLQGLVELDKPTPINANHKCFEGDVLNHRGWVVLSKVEFERTNPLWYDCEATVDYITHDINTKFQIFKGLKVNDKNMPDLQVDTMEMGENLSNNEVFIVDTDGGFIYDSDSEDLVNNIVTLDEAQHLSITTAKPLTDVSSIRFDWYSTRNTEFNENDISRVFSLKDDAGATVLEYEYSNFEFEDDYVTCTVTIRYMNEDGGWEEPRIINYMDMKTEIESDPELDDEDDVEILVDGEVVDEDDEGGDESGDDDDYENTLSDDVLYGTSLTFSLNKNKLIISDEGYSGREVYEEIELTGDNYTFETLWTNNNDDGTTEDIVSYIGVNLSETVLNTQYSQKYGNLMVSPFPIPYKQVVFTRESEEGTIYYLTGEQPFKYRIEPFYQYHCGTDLVTRDGISIFNLNNSYSYFYIENGLVRMGFNKYNGRISLAKWDIISKKWIPTHYFKMSEDTKFSMASYSDDKIVIKAGTDTFFTIWRGHPYIMVQNPTQDISIESNFQYCLSDMVDGNAEDCPLVWTFLNSENLLPNGIGGNSLDYKLLQVDDDAFGGETVITDVTVTSPSALDGTQFNISLSPSQSTGEVHYIVDGADYGAVSYPFAQTIYLKDTKDYTVQAIYLGEGDDVAISEMQVIKIVAPEPTQGSKADNGTPEAQIYKGKYSLALTVPSSLTYRDGKKITVQLRRGGVPMPNMVVEMQAPDGIATKTTDGDGKAYLTNTKYETGKWQVGARFYDNWDTDQDKKLLYTKLKNIEIKKAKATFTHTATDSKVKKGKNLKVKLNGIDSQENPSKAGLKRKKVIYTIDGGSRKTATTDEDGYFKIAMTTKGTKKVRCMFAGNDQYDKLDKTFSIKVI